MRGFLAFFIACAMTAALIPYPGLLWLWAAVLVLAFIVTFPERSEPRNRVVPRRSERGD